MIERLPGHKLEQIPMGFVDDPNRRNPNSVDGVYFLCSKELAVLDHLKEIKQEQFRRVCDYRSGINEIKERYRRTDFISFKEAGEDWYKYSGEDFNLKHRLLGLESGLVFQLLSGKGVFVSNVCLFVNGGCVSYTNQFFRALSEYESNAFSSDVSSNEGFNGEGEIQITESPRLSVSDDIISNVFSVVDSNFRRLRQKVLVIP